MENKLSPPCPWLPPLSQAMSYRDLQAARATGPTHLFDTALRYTQYLWCHNQPARAILALCRAIYVEPAGLPKETKQPYEAYSWILSRFHGQGFLGNPRISFLHQATRIDQQKALKRARAWAMWHLTIRILPALPTDSTIPESAPEPNILAAYLDLEGLTHEGHCFLRVLNKGSEGKL